MCGGDVLAGMVTHLGDASLDLLSRVVKLAYGDREF